MEVMIIEQVESGAWMVRGYDYSSTYYSADSYFDAVSWCERHGLSYMTEAGEII